MTTRCRSSRRIALDASDVRSRRNWLRRRSSVAPEENNREEPAYSIARSGDVKLVSKRITLDPRIEGVGKIECQYCGMKKVTPPKIGVSQQILTELA